jgi:hypothetical protein
MKPRKLSGKINPMIWTKVNGRLVGERWGTCPDFARAIGRPYATVLDMMRKGLIPAMEFGNSKRWICLTPLKRAKAAYRALVKAGRARP